jgi:hypothetical protein
MSLTDLASLGSFASGVAVLISLIYLGAQVRQATKHQQAQMLESRTSRLVDYQMRLAEPGLAPVWNKLMSGAHDLTEVEATQLVMLVRSNLNTGEAAFLQHEQGLMSDRAFESIRKNWVAFLSWPATRVCWAQARNAFDPAFAAWMDDRLAEAASSTSVSASLLNRAIAAESARSAASR